MQWEYKFIILPTLAFSDDSKRAERWDEILNPLGREGWEAVNMTTLIVLLKRPKSN